MQISTSTYQGTEKTHSCSRSVSVIPSPHTSLSRIFFPVGIGADSNSLPGADTEHIYMHMPGASTSASGSDQADEGHIVGLLSPAARACDEETEVEELLRETESHHEPEVEVRQDPLLLSVPVAYQRWRS